MPKSERPRERLKKYGKENISNEEFVKRLNKLKNK